MTDRLRRVERDRVYREPEMIEPTPDPDWFDARRFVVVTPKHTGNQWGVIDLKNNMLVIKDVSVEEAGVFSDTFEERYNRQLQNGDRK
jgi:hypothetical protein